MQITDIKSGEPPAGTRSFSEMLKANATRTEFETDKAGRLIGVKRLNFLDSHRLTKLLGDSATNRAAWNQVVITASVTQIDGDRLPVPQTIAQLEALMVRLDHHGFAAAFAAFARLRQESEDTVSDAKK